MLLVGTFLFSACTAPVVAPDAGVDAAPPAPDAGTRADAGSDAGPERARVLELRWVELVESAQTLAVVADARLAALPDEAVVVSVSLGGAPALFAPGTPGEVRVGDDTENRVTQALAWYDARGALSAVRPVASADPVLSGFAASGFALAALEDGTVLAGGRFLAGARFGGDDPEAVTLSTVRETPTPELTVTSEDGYVARFDPARRIEWARRGRSETGFAHHVVVDLDVLAGGSALLVGGYDGAITLGEGEANETRFTLSPGVEREVFLARIGPDGTLAWARRIAGHAEPRRVLALEDGASIVLFRNADEVRIDPGEPTEIVIAGPPTGAQEGDVVARFDADGHVVWARAVQADATTYPGLRDLRVEEDGSIVVAGTFRGRLAWPAEPDVAPIDVYGVEGLLARLDASGALLWQRRIRPVNSLQVQAITPAGGGSTWVAVTVSTHGASFLPDGGEPLVLPSSAASTRLVLLRYGLDGVLSAAHLAASDDVDADDLLRLASGDLVMVGRYGEGTVLEPETRAERVLPSARAFRNVFVARYSPVP